MITLPLIIVGVMCIFGGILALLLPETLNKPLPQTLMDAEKDGVMFIVKPINKNHEMNNI